MGEDLLPVPLNCVHVNKSGLLFSNPKYQLVVLKWRSNFSLTHSLELIDLALQHLAQMKGDALVFDMRYSALSSSATNVVKAGVHALQNGQVQRAVLLTTEDDFHESHPPEIQAIMDKTGAKVHNCLDFYAAAEWLDIEQQNPRGPWLTEEKPAEFRASYGGTVYSLPEYGATVMLSSGNPVEPDLVTEHYKAVHELHLRSGNSIAILDTTASPPVDEPARFQYVFNNVVLPLSISGAYKQVIHVRSPAAGLFFGKHTELIRAHFYSVGVASFDVQSMEQALKLVQVLQGREPGSLDAAGTFDPFLRQLGSSEAGEGLL